MTHSLDDSNPTLDSLAATVEGMLDRVVFPNPAVEALARYAAQEMRWAERAMDRSKWHAQVLACVRACSERVGEDTDETARVAAALAEEDDAVPASAEESAVVSDQEEAQG